jgi:DNA-binding CsgD family transcriptional regulator
MKIIQILESIFEEIVAFGVQLNRMNAKDLALLKELTDQIPHIIWINDYKGMKPAFVNNRAKDYYGYTDEFVDTAGFEIYKDLCHPDYYKDIHNSVAFWLETPREIMIHPYLAKTRDHSWRWTFTAAKAFKFSEKNEPEFILSLVFDFDDTLDKSLFQLPHVPISLDFLQKNQIHYNKLTDREVEILKLIGQGYSSKEMSETINISTSTIETHRNNIRQKLQAKNSHELVKFAILFHPEII